MVSAINPALPIYGTPTTESVRSNFAAAKSEIEALQASLATAPYLPISGGTMTGPMVLSANPSVPLAPATKQYVDGLVNPISTSLANYLLLAGGTLTGPLILAADPAVALGAATRQYVDAVATNLANYLPLAGGTLTGALTGTSLTLSGLLSGVSATFTGTFTVGSSTSGNGVAVLNAPAGSTRAIRIQTAGVNRWQLSPVTAESTGDAGSDFTIGRYSDTGTNLGSALTITRSTGAAKFQSGVSAWNINPPAARPAITGSRGGNAALASLITTMASYGFCTDSTTA